MDWCVSFPKEPVLMVRPSLRKACGGNRNAAKFLSYLLYRSSIREEAKTEAQNINEARRQQGLEPNQDTSITIYRTQRQIIEEMDIELSDRTLRDEAIPCLVELGYLTYEEYKGNKNYTAYTIYPEAIQEGINHSEKVPNHKTMQYHTASQVTRKNFRTEKTPNLSEDFPNLSEKTPNLRGNISERTNSDETSSEAAVEGKTEAPKSNKSNNKSKERNIEPLPFPVDKSTTPKRKPNKPKPDNELQARIDRVYEAFDSLFQEVTEDATSKYNRTQKATEAIKELLVCNPTPENLRLVYLHLWNTPATEKFSWRENMSIQAVCRNYDRTLAAVKGKKQASASKPYQKPTRSYVPDDFGYDDEPLAAQR